MDTGAADRRLRGAAGVVWGLDVLQRAGHAESGTDLAAAAARSLELWRAAPGTSEEIELPSTPDASLFFGEAGILLVACKLAPQRELADDLLAHVRENVANEFEELMWGSPGTLLAARAMHEWTGEERWAEAWRESAEALLARRDEDGLWTQRLYGKAQRLLGPAHGARRQRARAPAGRERVERVAPARDGTAARARGDRRGRAGDWPAVRGRAARSRQRERDPAAVVPRRAGDGRHRRAVPRRGAAARRRRAHVAGGRAPRGEGRGSLPRHGRERLRAAEGLRANRRRAWLERARRFAVHALAQVEAAPGRYSLFTGDVGVGALRAACLDADARFPVLDGWD